MGVKPLVSVVITTYERPRYLRHAIESVRNQTYDNIEIIVVDDNGVGSAYQQETSSVVREFVECGQIKYIAHTEHINGSAARNTGFKNSTGEYVAFLDDDDMFVPEKIELQIDELSSKPEEYGACTCNSLTHYSISSRVSKLKSEEKLSQEYMINECAFNTSTVLFRRAVLVRLNGFDEGFFRYQDWELFTRFFRHYKMCLVVSPYLVIRYCTPNVITKNPMVAVEYLAKFESMFKEDIDKMPTRNKVYKQHYEWLAMSLLSNHQKKLGIQYIWKACRYELPTLVTILKYIYSMMK